MSDEAGPLALVIGGGSGHRAALPRPTGPRHPHGDVGIPAPTTSPARDRAGRHRRCRRRDRMRWGSRLRHRDCRRRPPGLRPSRAGRLRPRHASQRARPLALHAAWVGARRIRGRPALSSPSRASCAPGRPQHGLYGGPSRTLNAGASGRAEWGELGSGSTQWRRRDADAMLGPSATVDDSPC